MKNIASLVVFATVLMGCTQSREAEFGPEDTVLAFYKALCSGEFEQAESLCDTPGMGGYIGDFRSAWESAGEGVMDIASDILSEMTVEVSSVEKNGQNRTIFFELASTGDRTKEKIATLKKEEGAWRIVQITDRN